MGINIGSRNDYSYLFSSMNNNKSGVQNSAGLTGLLGDYKSIKSGSYGKLLKAYYAGDSNSAVNKLANSKKSPELVTKDDAKKLNTVQTATDSLKTSVEKLSSGKEEDKDALYSAVSGFVNNYNSVINAVDKAGNSAVTNRGVSMANNTSMYEKSLNKIGIATTEDGTLSLDKDTFMKADVSSVKNLFKGSGSFGYQTSAQASLINYAAENAASKAATYTGSGSYNSMMNTGNVYNSFF